MSILKGFNLDGLPKEDQDFIAKYIFPTKKETAEHYSVYFHSPNNSAWYVFKSAAPDEIQQKIIRICIESE